MEQEIIEKIFIDYGDSLTNIKGNLHNLGKNNETPDLAEYMLNEITKIEKIISEARYGIITTNREDIYNENIYNMINDANKKLYTTIGELYDETKKGISEKYDEPLYNMCSIAMSINNFESSYLDGISAIPISQKGILKIGIEEKNREINNLRKELLNRRDKNPKK